MTENGSSQIVPVPFEKSVQAFHGPLAGFLGEIGLPVDDVLADFSERGKVLRELKSALEVVPIDDRHKAYYLSKFSVAVTVGLFDAALNYLWNETIAALGRLVVSIDLNHFFNVAERIDSKRKNLSTADDLAEISNHTLLESCRRIGLLSDVNFERLHHINYMRNYASAAHPNEIAIGGYELLGWLSVCLTQVICAQPERSVITVKRLLDNIRSTDIPDSDVKLIQSDIVRLPAEQIDDFLWTLFGMYVDPKVAAITKGNVAKLTKVTWDAASEDRKYEIGARYGFYVKNAEVAKKNSAAEFLTIVSGQGYKSEDVLAVELLDKLETLKEVHFEWNNFYNEYPHAKSLMDSIPPTGKVPRAARRAWVKVVCLCYVGNGLGYRQGVDESALVHYQKYIDAFGEEEITEFLHLFNDSEFIVDLNSSKTDKRLRELAQQLNSKSSNVHILRALDLVIRAPKLTLHKIAQTTAFADAVKYVHK